MELLYVIISEEKKGKKNVHRICGSHRPVDPFPLFQYDKRDNQQLIDIRVCTLDVMIDRSDRCYVHTVSGIKVGQGNHEAWSNVAQKPSPCRLLCN